MATPEIKNTQIRTGTNIGDMIEVVDVGGSTPGLPVIDASQILNLDTSQITSGTFPDARIAQTNITQHEDALAIDLPQLTQGGALTGQLLAWNDSASEWQAGADIWITTTTAVTATHGNKLLTDTSGGAFVVTLPATPSSGQYVKIVDGTGSWSTNNLTVSGNGNNINGTASITAAGANDLAFEVIYNGTQWVTRFGTP